VDHEKEWVFSEKSIELPEQVGDGDGDDADPPEGDGERGPGRPPRPDPFVTSRWGVWVAAGLIILFGSQSATAVWLSRSGLGTEWMAWVLGAVIIGTFTLALIGGARYIAYHRYGD